jgi:malonyl-CoA decarboxylase
MQECEPSITESTSVVEQSAGDADAARRALKLCHALVSEQGDVFAERLARETWTAYESLSGVSLSTFFDFLTRGFSPDQDLVVRRADAYRQDPSSFTLSELQRAVEPPRQELFRRLNLASGGTASLIEMRRRILCGLTEHPAWADIEADLAHLLRSWFNGGFLEFRRIDWSSSAAVLEKLIKYEAVHRIRDWRALRRRLENDRRCFGFFHPSLPDEPLVFTELALTDGLSARVQPLLDPDTPILDPQTCNCAVFYSISNCHEGLRGVSFGNALIRRAIDHLRSEFPRLKTLATLSPVPGFREWLVSVARDGNRDVADLIARLSDTRWIGNSALSVDLGRALVPLCASYLLDAKRGQQPADPVARFHLRNGARLERLNWLGDTSEAGLDRSLGMTANYRYRLADIERNRRAYVTEWKVMASPRVHKLSESAARTLLEPGACPSGRGTSNSAVAHACP